MSANLRRRFHRLFRFLILSSLGLPAAAAPAQQCPFTDRHFSAKISHAKTPVAAPKIPQSSALQQASLPEKQQPALFAHVIRRRRSRHVSSAGCAGRGSSVNVRSAAEALLRRSPARNCVPPSRSPLKRLRRVIIRPRGQTRENVLRYAGQCIGKRRAKLLPSGIASTSCRSAPRCGPARPDTATGKS